MNALKAALSSLTGLLLAGDYAQAFAIKSATVVDPSSDGVTNGVNNGVSHGMGAGASAVAGVNAEAWAALLKTHGDQTNSGNGGDGGGDNDGVKRLGLVQGLSASAHLARQLALLGAVNDDAMAQVNAAEKRIEEMTQHVKVCWERGGEGE